MTTKYGTSTCAGPEFDFNQDGVAFCVYSDESKGELFYKYLYREMSLKRGENNDRELAISIAVPY